MKKYCREILDCIAYLHTPSPDVEPTGEAAGAAEATPGGATPLNSAGGGGTEKPGSKRKPKPAVMHRDVGFGGGKGRRGTRGRIRRSAPHGRVTPPTPPPTARPLQLKCDNIFIQGKSIKIGDLGLATTDGTSVLGTPEFM